MITAREGWDPGQKAASRSRANSAASAASFQCAFNPLGLGSTQTWVLPNVCSCRPVVAPGLPNAVRYTVMPTTASHCGARRATLAASTRPPARISSAVSSSARAVARATTLVMPRPSGSRSSCSSGRSTRLVKPAAYSAGQNRFPGRAKWYPVAAEYRPGLMPANSTLSAGPATSGMVLSLAAVRSQDEGRRVPVTTSRLQPVVTTGYCSARPRRAASVAGSWLSAEVTLGSRLARRASAREDINGCRREQHRGDHDVNPPARHAKQVEAVVDGTDDEAA